MAVGQNEEEIGKYANVNNDSSRDTNEVHLDTDASTEFSGKGKTGDIEQQKWNNKEEDIVKLDGEHDDIGSGDPNKA